MADLLAETRDRSTAARPRSVFELPGRRGTALQRCSMHAGCNVENAAYPQGVCAEAGAISAMVLAGGRRIVELVIAGAGPRACPPCGGCRQKIREFAAPDCPIRMVDETGALLLQSTLGELLPDSFGPEALGF